MLSGDVYMSRVFVACVPAILGTAPWLAFMRTAGFVIVLAAANVDPRCSRL